jgi:hypothetical protein
MRRDVLGDRLGEPVNAVLVPEHEPGDPSWQDACRSVGVTLLPAPRIDAGLPHLLPGGTARRQPKTGR